MKKFFLMLVVTAFAFAATAQTAQTEKSAGKTEMKGKYCCAKCDYCSDKAGQCPNHKMDLVMEGMYYCSMMDCKPQDKSGKCPKCGMDLMKMEKKMKKDEKKMEEKK